MTQKELLYVEDAIGHEQTVVAACSSIVEQLEDEELIDYMNNEINTHQEMLNDLVKALEDEKNE